MKRSIEEDIRDVIRDWPAMHLQQVKRDIAKEVAGSNGENAAVAAKAHG